MFHTNHFVLTDCYTCYTYYIPRTNKASIVTEHNQNVLNISFGSKQVIA